jgi:hypothetical protein
MVVDTERRSFGKGLHRAIRRAGSEGLEIAGLERPSRQCQIETDGDPVFKDESRTGRWDQYVPSAIAAFDARVVARDDLGLSAASGCRHRACARHNVIAQNQQSRSN